MRPRELERTSRSPKTTPEDEEGEALVALVQESLPDAVAQAASQYHRLVLLVGPPGSRKTALLRAWADAQGQSVVNVSLRLAEQLLDLPARSRPGAVQRLLSAILKEAAVEAAALDNLELLFCQDLGLDPLHMLQAVSRNHTVIATWSGAFQDGVLTYAEPAHPEGRRYHRVEAVIVPTHPEEKP